MTPPVILYSYDFSPYAQKIRLLLTAAKIPFSICDQPPVLPRPDLQSLGIHYRRIPLLAVGKDVYCDTTAIVDVIQKELGGLPESAADRAYEAFGREVFWSCLAAVPGAMLSGEFVKDRETIFPVLSRPDLATIRPSALAEFRAVLTTISHDFLGPKRPTSGPFIHGPNLSLADIHVAWVTRWMLRDLGLGQEAGFTATDFPAVHRWIEALPPDAPAARVSGSEAAALILGSGAATTVVVAGGLEPLRELGIEEGTEVGVESTDSKPGSHPQHGELVGLDGVEVVVRTVKGVRLHFPRRGYVVKKR
ncbi:hypothetical protein K490DRAFT_67363 [Saccharata proteae CBS 121410]|uniref:GST N-terminal domain-containing protein n=1 Tax=Saccharata proteae CBS 121410 TaxID=1314787 RepID=A0A9P4HSI8_9PEZI|nr:hypothetical protein K490DRAFT_67363 [Saccharata proteae CBS 121410]